MNKTLPFALAILTGIVVLSGCTRTSYAIHTNDARTIISDGKPHETEAGLLGYTDANGVKRQINKSEVKEILEVPK